MSDFENPVPEHPVVAAGRLLSVPDRLAGTPAGRCSDQEDASGAAPPNAHMKRYGSGYIRLSGNYWKCNRGYQKRDDSCVAVEVPSNGYLDASGCDWSCERGFKKGRRSCLAFQVPTHAHLGYSGNSWTDILMTLTQE